jgi:GAF domain-containing protein
VPDGRPRTGRALTDPERLAGVAARLGNPDPVDELTLTMLLSNVAEIARARTAVAGLALNDTVLTVAGVGLPDLINESGGVPVEWTPAGMVVGGDRPVLLADMRADPVYRHTPMSVVCGVRSYAGVPLHAADGMVIGVLSVMDTAPGRFSAATIRGLLSTTPTVMSLLDRRLRP